MIPEYYEFFNSVEIISGRNTIDLLPRELKSMGANKPIVITDRGVVDAGLIEIVGRGFEGSDALIGAVYDKTPVDSSSLIVNEIASIYRQKGCDSIVAVGGGSAIDTAKGVNILVSEGADDLLVFSGYNRLRKKQRPFVIVPTTAGTGSEVTMAAVIANPEKKIKMSFISPLILPGVALLDPRMTLTMPPKITAASGMDALTHAIEAYMCLQKNPLSDSFAFGAIELIMKNLIKAVENGRDEDARLAMSDAALLAGLAFSNSMVGIIHSIAHALGGVCHVPHGMANAIILPFGMEYNMARAGDYISDLLLPLGGAEKYSGTPPAKRAEKSIDEVRSILKELNARCGLPVTLGEAGVDRGDFKAVATAAINDGSVQYNPEAVEYEAVMDILNRAY